jgi:myo-inositol-1(or 4)-monophosphatase
MAAQTAAEKRLMGTILRAAREGARIVRHHFASGRVHVREKSRPGDLVSNVDLEVEKAVMGMLAREYPGIPVVSEELGDEQVREEAFYLDPVDGTLNFVHGLLPFAVSLAYWRDGPQAGVVVNPTSGEVFSALAGHGARRNGRPIAPSRASRLRDGLVATGWPYDRAGRALLLTQMERVYMGSQELRTIGCASLGLCYVAAGIFDGYWEWGLKPWDMAAGVLMVTEAGGRVSSLRGGEFRLGEGEAAASNGLIHEELVASVNV